MKYCTRFQITLARAHKSYVIQAMFVFLIFGATTSPLFAQNPYDSRNMNIPTEPGEIDTANQKISTIIDGAEIRLHYNIGLLEKVTGFVYTQGRIQTELAQEGKYMGIEPSSFSKPNESIYKKRVGFFAGPFRKAVASNSESANEINRYRMLKSTSVLLLAAAAFTAGVTLTGVIRREYPFSSTRDNHIIYGTGLTFALTGSAIIPSIFNRGRIQKAAAIYNKGLRKQP